MLIFHLRYSPACSRLLSQYKTMLKLVGDDVPSVEEFMKRYRVRMLATLTLGSIRYIVLQMDYSAALHRVKIGVPATVEHPTGADSGSGPETAKWVAETTQVRASCFVSG